jgi:DNA polymerase III alpha subunit/intein/homing endonuclease
MTDIKFSPLHLHSEFSLLDGATKIDRLPQRLKELGMTACAITDHGEMGGVAKFEKALRKEGLKPILGCEIYMTDDRTNIARDTKTWHLTLLATNTQGYSNLSSITSHAHISSQKVMPGGRRVGIADWDLMYKYREGIICLTGCMAAPVMGEIMHGGSLDIARAKLERLIETFGKGNVYGEIQDAGVEVYIPADSQVGKLLQEHRGRTVIQDDEGHDAVICSQADGNWVLVEHLCKPINLPYVATGDTHYIHAEDAQNHDALICAGTGQKIRGGRRRFSLLPQKYYLKSKEEMAELFAHYPEALERTQEIADRCSDEEIIQYGVDMVPKFPYPEEHGSAEDYLRHLVYKGIDARYGKDRDAEVDKRVEYELGIIIQMGFVDFFLIIGDWIDWCRERDIPIGPGRGCLTGDIPVRTRQGYVPLADIRIGDEVLTHTGQWCPVSATMQYPCDEKLIQLRAFYDDARGVTMTGDHKVLVERGRETPGYLNKTRRWLHPEFNLEWVEAKDIQVGDYVAIPIDKSWKDTCPAEVYDLRDYADPEHTVVRKQDLVEYAATDLPNDLAIRTVSRQANLSRGAVQNVTWNGSVPQATLATLENHLSSNGDSVDSWIENRAAAIRTSRTVLRHIKVDRDFCTLLGIIVSDGWIPSGQRNAIGIAVNREEDDGLVPDLMRKIFGLEPQIRDHKRSGLRQYLYHSGSVFNLLSSLMSEDKQTTQDKSLCSNFIRSLSRINREALINGLWYAGGSHEERSKYTTTSYLLAQQVRELLWSLGLPAGLRHERREDGRPDFPDCSESYSILTPHNFNCPPQDATWAANEEYILLRVREINEGDPEPVYDISVPGDTSYTTSSFAVHNSAAGSVVSYALGVTAVDPLEFDLLFERFLDINRISLPDIDVDIAQGQLQAPRAYVRDKYNALASALYNQDVETAVTQIGTLGRYKPKAAIKAAARVLNVFYEEGMTPEEATKAVKDGMKLGDKLSNYIPKLKLPSGNKLTMDNCLKEISDLKKAYDNDPKAHEIIELAKFFEDYISNFGVHAAAVIINDRPLETLIPLRRASVDDPITTAFEQGEDEDIGTLKQDFLGLKTLDVIWDARRMIREEHGNNIFDPWSREYIPWDDKPTWDLLSRAESIGVFQVESPGMQHVLKSVRPDNMGHLSDIVALFRPGPMDSIPSYARRKNGHEEVTFGDPRLEDVLGQTYSILVYQEQIMRVSRDLAGFTPQEADGLRKAVGKKLADKIAEIKKPFYAGCKKNGVPPKVIDELWVTIEAAGRYAFNKSHSVCYALIAYVTAYLKANYPAAFMAANLSINIGNKDKMPILLNECRRMKLRVLPPDINRSDTTFSIHQNKEEDIAEHGSHEILFGLSAVAGVGGKVVDKLIEDRQQNGPFTDFYEFVKRAHFLSSAQIEALVKAGALDALIPARKGAFEQVRPTLERYKKEYDDKIKERKKLYRQHAKLAFHEVSGAEGKAPTLAGAQKRLAENIAKHEIDDNQTPENLLELALLAQTADWELGVRRELKKAHPDYLKAEIDELIADRHDREEARLQVAAEEMVPGIRETIKRVHEQLKEDAAQNQMLAHLAFTFPALGKEEWPRLEKLNYEREVLKLFVSGHPLDENVEAWTRFISIGLGEVSDKYIGWETLICGVITASEYKTFPSGFALHKVILDDLTGSREVTLFKSAVEDGSHKFLEVGNIVSMIVTIEEDSFVNNNDDEDDEDESKAVKLSGRRVRVWDPNEQREGPILVTFPEGAEKETLQRAINIIKSYPGEHEIMLKRNRYAEPKKAPYGVEMNHILFRDLRRLLGRKNVV